MYLIPLDNDSVYYNATALDSVSLATIVLLAIAYHPTYSNLLYLLYGTTSFGTPGSTYGNINVMIRNMATKAFLQNTTITQDIECNRYCEIKVTENLFLIESQSLAVIYRLKNDQQIDVASPADSFSKSTTFYIGGLATNADIYKNRYVVLNYSTNIFILGEVNSTGVTIKNLAIGSNVNDIVAVGLTDKYVYTAVNYTNITVILYSCVSCIFSGSMSEVGRIVINTGVTVSFNYRFYQGGTTSESNVTNAYIFVGSGDGDSRKYYINQTTYQQDPIISVYRIAAVSSANSYQYMTYGSSLLINRYFAYNQSDQNTQFISFDRPVYQVALSSDSKVMALHDSENSWNVKQYQMVSDCSLYATNNSNATNGTNLCPCIKYDSQNYCAYNGTSTDTSTASSSGSFPIGAVVGVVAGVVAVSVMVVKKNYKKCQKRHRTPWKYNPVQLMSFEV